MSNPLKSVGKVFKKVAKVVMKVAPFALAAAAVIFTGGAALGLTPTFAGAVGGLVTKLGLSAGLSGALTGAVTSAGFGSALGLVTGGTKGMKKGFLMGALTGGVLGAVNPSMFGIAKTIDAAGNTVVTTTNALAHGGKAFGAAGKGAFTVTRDAATGLYHAAPKGAPAAASSLASTAAPASQALSSPTAPAPAAQPAAMGGTPTQTGMLPAAGAGGAPASAGMNATAAPISPTVAAPTAPASAGGGGVTGMLSNPLIMGNMLQGIGGMLGGKDNSYKDKAKAEQEMGEWAYGGTFTGSSDPYGTKTRAFASMQPRYVYDPVNNIVVDRNQGVG